MGCVLISGCSSGFGLEAALAFGRRGDRVVAGLRTLANRDVLRERVEAEALPVEISPLDVRDPMSIDTCVRSALDRHGEIDALVNNAGIGAIGALEDTADDVVRRLLEVNVVGLLALSRAVLPAMRKAPEPTSLSPYCCAMRTSFFPRPRSRRSASRRPKV